MGTPAVEPKTLPFGRRISFRDDKSDLLIVKRETVSYYEVQGPCAIEQRTSIYSPFEVLSILHQFHQKGISRRFVFALNQKDMATLQLEHEKG